MFEPHFGLRENPFSTSHDPRFVYPSPEHLEAVAHFRYGVQNREAFVLVTGEVGTGKTTAVRDLVARLPQQAHVALLQNTSLTRHELLEEVCGRFQVAWDDSLSKPALLQRLESALGEALDRGETCLLIIDEAQNLDGELLEEVRLLSNLEWRGGHLLQICLAGQPELEDRLATPELRPLRQRISVKYRIQPLDVQETERYIHHRLRVAGGDGPRIFPTDATAAVHEITHGIPREINIVAGQALLNAYVEGSPVVPPPHVRQEVTQFGFQSVQTRSHPAAPAPAPPPAPPPLASESPASAAVSARPAVVPTLEPTPPPVPLPTAQAAVPPPIAAPAAVPAAAVGRTSAEPAVTPTPTLTPPPTPSLPPAPRRVPAAPERTVSNWRDRPAAPLVLPPTPADPRAVELEGARESGPSLWSRIPLWVPIAGVLIVTAVAFLASGMGSQLWRSLSAPPVEEQTPATSAEEPAPAARPAASAASASIATPSLAGGAYALQVASFRTERKARAALAEMDAATGLGGRVVNSPGGADPWFRVVIGSFATREDARARSAELMGRGIVPEDCMVVAAPRRAGVEPPSAP